MKNNICCLFNYGSHYRASIYQLLDKEMGCDFYLGDQLPGNIRKMDYNSLSGYMFSFKNVFLFKNCYWQKGTIRVLFKSYKHYLIDGEPYNLSNWVILIFARVMNKKVYTWTHGWYGRETNLKRNVKKLFFRMAYHNFLYGDYAKELMIKEGFLEKRMSCVYNSLDYDNQLVLRNKMKESLIFINHFGNQFRNLLFVGRLTKSKRLDMIMSALVELKQKSKEFNLIIIGDGDAKADLIQLADELKLSKNIWFYGESYNELELSELIYNADLCVSPGNIGLTAIHSMSFGTPVITHNNFPNQGPEFESIVDGVTGAFFTYESVESLVESILRWFETAPLRDEVRKKCYKVIDSRYNPYFQIEVFKKIIR